MGENFKNLAFVANMGEDSISVVNLDMFHEREKINLYSHYLTAIGKKPFLGPHDAVLDYNNKYLYTTNSHDSSVRVVDLIQNKVVKDFAVGSCPSHIAICKKKKAIYVSNTDSNSISILDMDTGELLTQIPTGNMPHHIKLSNDREKLYVLNLGSDNMTIIDTNVNDMEKTIPVNGNPYHMVLNKAGNILFIVNTSFSNMEGGSITLLDTKEYRIIDKIRVGKMPVEAILDKHEENLYITDSELNAVNVFSIKEKRLVDRIYVGRMPGSISFTPNYKYLLVSNVQDNTLSIIEVDKYRRKMVQTIKVGKEPNCIVVI
ncbi:YncE family protein [Anaeromicrobium sediminis]|uniref:YNCE-like beta-propeller domain-containing protein n=1 Tax=Anaeromicrobium sediminis TaxID=1478221 RepID=A0A267MIR3_9FIRM|nr:beta-propeller fold lactonase family protein [Anaeromicrobium sediminis]PAB59474.1 hypothetical protein CCE28_09665 [Anaeromicrobium sediminis]